MLELNILAHRVSPACNLCVMCLQGGVGSWSKGKKGCNMHGGRPEAMLNDLELLSRLA
jgi:hypothetical protein